MLISIESAEELKMVNNLAYLKNVRNYPIGTIIEL